MQTRQETQKSINATALSWQAFPTSEAGFLRAPVLVSGSHEAVLIDAGFTYPDAQVIVEAIQRSGKSLKSVYISVNDPDYYFNLPIISRAFPQAEIIAAPETVKLIQEKAPGKLATWSPQLGANGPAAVSDLVIPKPSSQSKLTVDGHAIEIITTKIAKDRGRYLWVPSLSAVFGGVAVFGGMYPWVADVSSLADRKAWIATLDGILARKPEIVVPGHIRANWPMDLSGVTYTRDFLIAFNEEDARSKDAAELIAAMRKRYPNDAMPISLEMGAKVVKHEMQWG